MKIKQRMAGIITALVCMTNMVVGTAVIAEAETITFSIGYCAVDTDGNGEFEYVEITDCDENADSIVIPSEIEGLPVKVISYSAFDSCKNLTYVKIPSSVEIIESNAFNKCSALKTVEMEDGLKTIRHHAFYYCTSLDNVVIPDTVTSIENSAFAVCGSMKSIKLSENIGYIADETFSYCSSLNNIVIPSKVMGIGSLAFTYCSSLTDITIPENVHLLNNNAFNDTPILTADSTVKYADTWVISCDNVESVEIREGTYGICSNAFSNCNSLSEVKIPDSVHTIADEAFSGTALLNNQTGIKYADKWVVDFDSSIASAEINDGTIGIADNAFWKTLIEEITIPESVTKIGSKAFCGSGRLKKVNLPNSIESIPVEMFSYCVSLSEITIPDSVKTINTAAFEHCYELKNIDIPNSVTHIGGYAFKRSGLESVTIPNSVTSVGVTIFNECSSLKNVTLSENITALNSERNIFSNLPTGFFEGCSSLESIVVPKSVKYIDADTFARCLALESITIENPDCVIYDEKSTLSAWKDDECNKVIFGHENSTAQAYAEKYGYEFLLIGEKMPVDGDISGNGEIDIYDAIEVSKFVMGMRVFTDKEKNRADFNADGNVDIYDAIDVARVIMN